MRLSEALRTAMAVLAVVLASVAMVRQHQHDAGDDFTISRGEAEIRAHIHEGIPTLELVDSDGDLRVVLRPEGLSFYNKAGVVVAAMDAMVGSHAGIRLRQPSDSDGEQDRPDIFLAAGWDGSSTLSLKGRGVIRLRADSEQAEIMMSGLSASGAVSAPGIRIRQGPSRVSALDHEGNVVWQSK